MHFYSCHILCHLPGTALLPLVPASHSAAPEQFGEITAAAITRGACGCSTLGEGLPLCPTHLVPWALSLCSCTGCQSPFQILHELLPLNLFSMEVPNQSKELLWYRSHSLPSVLVFSPHVFTPFVPRLLPPHCHPSYGVKISVHRILE